MTRAMKIVGILGILLITGGCAQLAASVVNQVAVATVDQKVSDILERDCNSYRFVRGGDYCEEQAFVDPGPQVYCYKTLGGVDCHEKPDPYKVSKHGRTNQPKELATPSYKTMQQQADANRERLRRRRGDDEPRDHEPEWRVPQKRPPQNVSDETDI